MSYILNIETSTTNCSVSLSYENNLIDCQEIDSPNYSHSENLHVFIDDLMKRNKLKFNQLKACAISRGPGSYTCLLYTSPSPRDGLLSRMPSSA